MQNIEAEAKLDRHRLGHSGMSTNLRAVSSKIDKMWVPRRSSESHVSSVWLPGVAAVKRHDRAVPTRREDAWGARKRERRVDSVSVSGRTKKCVGGGSGPVPGRRRFTLFTKPNRGHLTAADRGIHLHAHDGLCLPRKVRVASHRMGPGVVESRPSSFGLDPAAFDATPRGPVGPGPHFNLAVDADARGADRPGGGLAVGLADVSPPPLGGAAEVEFEDATAARAESRPGRPAPTLLREDKPRTVAA